MKTLNGKIFEIKPAEEVLDFLKSRKIRKIECSPRNINLVDVNGNLRLRVKTNKFEEFPVRESFYKKLLKWNSLPVDLMGKIGSELSITVLNTSLQNFKAWYVDIHLEDNEAKTITSKFYTEISNLELYELIKDLEISTISHDDYITRFYTRKKYDANPIFDDHYGFGFDIVNSETGFAALSLSHFILRYVCINGATAPIHKYHWSQEHYAKNKRYLINYVKNQIEIADYSRNKLLLNIKKSNDIESVTVKREVVSRLNYLLSFNEQKMFMNKYNWNDSVYSLFNYITYNAKTYDINKRYQLERLAGALII